ncbi:hypothetical protein ACFU6S_04080 [Streptomyces sp. NPDC057456]|uniref:hypothetical protein n=1 Tax=Streptomyces sp. NPDC057456 TaxID=3346139 RepID=UPI0036B578A1
MSSAPCGRVACGRLTAVRCPERRVRRTRGEGPTARQGVPTGWSSLVYDNDVLVFLGTYSTTLFLVYFPMGILVARLRPWTAAASIAFHVSIGVFMGLTAFALTMIACDLIFLSSALARARRTARGITARWTPKQPGGVRTVTEGGAPDSDRTVDAPVPQTAN